MSAVAIHDDERLCDALRRGEEKAFAALVERYHSSLLRLARHYVRDRAVAEEVVQETWLGVVTGLERFEGRSSLKTWIFRILVNCARTRGAREARSVPFSALEHPGEPAVEPERFLESGPYAGHWAVPPARWEPEGRLLGSETRAAIAAAIESLPATQRTVISLRDVEGWDASEVCELLGLSEVNQRVLLHRARSAVRRGLELYFEGGEE